MAFKRPETRIVPADLTTLAPVEVERKIIDGVRKYATRQDNWADADKNTPFLGQIIGMGIESSNRVDITMMIERQFLTRKTKRAPLADGSNRFRLEEGELGKLMILEGEDTFAATPGLAVKMLMDVGHMPMDRNYLKDVVSFAAVVTIGDGYRLNESLRKALSRLERASEPAGRQEALSNVRVLSRQVQTCLETTAHASDIERSRHEAYLKEKAAYSQINAELDQVSADIQGLSASSEAKEREALISRQSALRLRAGTAAVSLQIAQKVSSDAANCSAADASRIQQVRGMLQTTWAQASRALNQPECSSATIS